MNKHTKSILAAALIAGTIGVTAAVSAMPNGPGPGCDRGGHSMKYGQHERGKGPNLERMAARLGLSDEQRVEIKTIIDGSLDEATDLREQMRANRDQLRELMQQGGFDEAAVRSIADKQGDLKADMIVLRARQRSEMQAVLTDGQRAKMAEMRERKNHRGKGY